MRRLRAAVLLAPLILAACSSGPGTDSLGVDDDYSVLGALGEVPAAAAGEQFLVATADVASASAEAGLSRPDGVDDPDAFRDWIGPLTGGPGADRMHAQVMVPMGNLLSQHMMAPVQEVDAELGWSLVDVDAFVELTAPPLNYAVVVGDDLAPAEGLPEVTDGIVTAGEGEDYSVDPGDVTAARPIGSPLRMAVDAGGLAASNDTTLLEDWLAGSETLADDPVLAAVAAELDDEEVLSALVSRGHAASLVDAIAGRQLSPEQAEKILADHEDLVPVGPFGAVGIGFGVDDGEGRVTVVLHFDDDAAAEAAVPVLERQFAEANSLQTGRPVSDMFRLLDAEAEGPMAVLEMVPSDGATVHMVPRLLMVGDLPFVHL